MTVNESYPSNPTNGWMASKLEELGVKVRGTPLFNDAEKMARMLKKRGYNVSHKIKGVDDPNNER